MILEKRDTMKKLLSVLLIVGILSGVIYLGMNQKLDESLKKEEEDQLVVEEEAVDDRVESITVVSIGDIMYHSTQIKPTTTHPSGYDFHDSMALTKPYFEAADITIGNYESTSTDTQDYRGYPTFNTPVESLDAIADSGFDILSTINNHTLDSGKQGLIDTYKSIEERGMIPLGTKISPDIESLKTIEKNDIKLGFLAYTYGYNGLDGYLSEEEHEYMVSPMDEARMEKEIKSSLAAENDLTVIMVHWGEEYQTKPSASQREFAQKMVDWGADIILGSHPHVVQEAEMIGDAYVIYSMGNYISDQRLESIDDINTERGLMIEFNIEKSFADNKTVLKEVEYHPLWVNKYWDDTRNFYEAIPTRDYLDGKIDPYVPQGSQARIQAAHDETLKRVKGDD